MWNDPIRFRKLGVGFLTGKNYDIVPGAFVRKSMSYSMTKQGAKHPGEFHTTTASHLTQCGLFCSQNAVCSSYDYNEKDSVCLLNQKQLADVEPGKVIADSDFGRYESREKRKKTTLPDCLIVSL